MIELRLRSDNGDALVEVIDSGEGIPKRELPRIFERFYRVDTARARATGGTGLGLAIVRHVAEGHGGSVQVESELGRGSTFRLRIPQAEDAQTPELTPGRSPLVAKLPRQAGSSSLHVRLGRETVEMRHSG